MKNILCCILCFILLSYNVVASADEPITMLEVVPNISNNEVSVLVEYSSTNMCGGSFNFIYDTNALRLVAIEEGETIKNTTRFINSEFAEGTIRINWASTTIMPTEGNLINIKFEMLNEAFNKSDISIGDLKVADGDGNKLNAKFIIVYDEYEQINPPTDNDIENSYKPILKPSSGNSSAKQENEINRSETSIVFTDVEENDWFYANVQYVVENKLMNGVAGDKFAPNSTLTRAMLVTVLYRNAGEPDVNNSAPFADVDMGTWYANSVVWAKQNGIVNGVNETDFAPDSNITREQIAAIMFRYAQYKGMDAVTLEENLHFADSSEISEYAVSAMNWTVGTGLIKGKSATTINPKDNATRAEIAAILQRFIESNN